MMEDGGSKNAIFDPESFAYFAFSAVKIPNPNVVVP
jgi:hypothetical protein